MQHFREKPMTLWSDNGYPQINLIFLKDTPERVKFRLTRDKTQRRLGWYPRKTTPLSSRSGHRDARSRNSTVPSDFSPADRLTISQFSRLALTSGSTRLPSSSLGAVSSLGRNTTNSEPRLGRYPAYRYTSSRTGCTGYESSNFDDYSLPGIRANTSSRSSTTEGPAGNVSEYNGSRKDKSDTRESLSGAIGGYNRTISNDILNMITIDDYMFKNYQEEGFYIYNKNNIIFRAWPIVHYLLTKMF